MKDEKFIRKHYGEKMWHFCRTSFSTILEEEGKLSSILDEKFDKSHNLFSVLEIHSNLETFKNYIYSLIENKEEKIIEVIETPKELLDKAGYILYECNTEEEIQSFKKYYKTGEKLCTFNGGRLNSCYVFFAVKKNVDDIKRYDFKDPKREDEYGTSVISIQFTKEQSHTLSIKNRYNHTVANPDATFSNNLDNIIEGLTDSFEKFYGLKQSSKQIIDFKNLVQVEGKFYIYNYEINNKYYCDNNIIIDGFTLIDKYQDKSRYQFIDYMILDLKEKRIFLYDEDLRERFMSVEKDIRKIEITKDGKNKIIRLHKEEGCSEIVIDELNRMISYKNNTVTKIPPTFLLHQLYLKELEATNVENIDYEFLFYNKILSKITLPKLRKVTDWFLNNNLGLKKIYFPNLTECGTSFLTYNTDIEEVNLPKLRKVQGGFLFFNKGLKKISLPSLYYIGHDFISNNTDIEEIHLPNLYHTGGGFMKSNEKLKKIVLENINFIGDDFLRRNETLKEIELPNTVSIGDDFLLTNNSLEELITPKLESVGSEFLFNNTTLKKILAPNLRRTGSLFMYSHPGKMNLILKNVRNLKVHNIIKYYKIIRKGIINNKRPDRNTRGGL